MRIANMNTGFIEIPNRISLNIYAQGCKLHCEGCHNAEIRDFYGGVEVPVDLMENMLEGYKMADWICFLGGDATYQPEEMLKFCRLFKENNKSVVLYTGRLFNEVKYLLKDVDLVIDGPWQGIPVTNEGTNQKVYMKVDGIWNEITWKELKEINNAD